MKIKFKYKLSLEQEIELAEFCRHVLRNLENHTDRWFDRKYGLCYNYHEYVLQSKRKNKFVFMGRKGLYHSFDEPYPFKFGIGFLDYVDLYEDVPQNDRLSFVREWADKHKE